MFVKYRFKLIISIIALLFILSTFAMYWNEYSTYVSDSINFQNSEEITKDNEVTENFICEFDNLYKLCILFTTNDRINSSELRIELKEENILIQKWNINASLIANNQYLILDLKHESNCSNKQYTLHIRSNAQAGNGVTPLEYKLQYNTLEHKYLYKPFVLILIIAILISYIFTYITSCKSYAIENVFIILWCAFSLLYMCSNTMYNVPDERNHFYRAYEISMGHMVSGMNESGTEGGQLLPLDVEFSTRYWQSYIEAFGVRLSENVKFFGFSNTALYAPISYIPQAVGVFLARAVTERIIFIAYAGRIANWLCVSTILYFVIKFLPVGKVFLTIVLLMPMNLQQAFSMSPDGMVIAIS